LHFAGRGVDQNASRIDVAMRNPLSVQSREYGRKLNRYLEEKIKISGVRREQVLKREAASIFEHQPATTLLAKQSIDAWYALDEELAESFKLSLE
jgi:hypothetical protein